MANNVIIVPATKPNTIVNHNQAQNSSWNAIGRIPNTVVIVVTNIGISLDFHASRIDS